MARRTTQDIIPAAVQDETGELVRDAVLTPGENAIIEMLVIKGNDYLDTLGWSQHDKTAFLNRPNVMLAIERQQRAMSDGERIFAAQAFFTRLRLGDMLPQAVRIIQQTLSDNPKKRPSPEQVSAAREVMDRVGLGGQKGQVNVAILHHAPVDHTKNYDAKNDRVAVMQRNNVRQVIDAIVNIANKTDRAVELLEEAKTIRKKKKKKRHG